jgi:hypothetical protein
MRLKSLAGQGDLPGHCLAAPARRLDFEVTLSISNLQSLSVMGDVRYDVFGAANHFIEMALIFVARLRSLRATLK